MSLSYGGKKKFEYDAHSEVLSLEGLEDDPGWTSVLSLQSEKTSLKKQRKQN